MNIAVEPQPNCRAVIRVDIPPDLVGKERERVVAAVMRQARLPGFRPGKAPRAIVTKRFEAEIKSELEEALVRSGFQEANRRGDVDILNVLGVREQALHADDSYSFALDVSTAPRFELPDYKAIPVKLPRIEVGDEDIDHDMLHLRENHRTFADVDRGALAGDYVVLHAAGSVDGAPMEQAHPDAPAFLKKIEGNWFELTEEETFLPGFFAALHGIRKDETREVTVAIPADFPFEPLRGRAVAMAVKCDAVKEARIPALDEEFAKKVNAEWDLARLREEVRQGVTRRREHARDESLTNQVIAHLAERLEFELPAEVVKREAQRRTNDIAMNALRQGMGQEAIMGAQDQIVSAATQQARQSVKVNFILGEIAKREKIEVRDDQVQRALARIAARERIAPKKLLAEAQKTNLIERLRDDILLDNAVEFLKANAAIEETDPEKEDCGHKH